MNKKAMEMRILAFAILGLISAAVLLFFFKDISISGENMSNRELCKASIEMGANRNIRLRKEIEGLVDPYGNPVKIECSTKYYSYDEKDPEAVKDIIASKMVECWNLYGEGEIELFETKDNGFCVVCSRLEFSEKVEINDFILFLKDNTIYDNHPQSYWGYLMKTDVENYKSKHYENTKLEEYDYFTTKEPLAVVYYMDKDAYPGLTGDLLGKHQSTKIPQAIKLGAGGTVAGLGIGVLVCVAGAPVCGTFGIFVGATTAVGLLGGGKVGYAIGADRSADWDARVLLVPYDSLNELECARLEAKSTPLKIMNK